MIARRPRALVETERLTEIPMTPMIDVVFQLLIFFMLTMHFKEIEGKLLSQLPRDKGPAASARILPQVEEIRITLCCDPEGDIAGHRKNRMKHDAALEALERKEWAQGKRLGLNDQCVAWVMDEPLGKLYETAVHADRKAHNRAIYRQIAGHCRKKADLLPLFKDPAAGAPIVLDADSAVPYEHVVGIVDECIKLGLANVEMVSSSRYLPRK